MSIGESSEEMEITAHWSMMRTANTIGFSNKFRWFKNKFLKKDLEYFMQITGAPLWLDPALFRLFLFI